MFQHGKNGTIKALRRMATASLTCPGRRTTRMEGRRSELTLPLSQLVESPDPTRRTLLMCYSGRSKARREDQEEGWG